jgi:hypothetical protein
MQRSSVHIFHTEALRFVHAFFINARYTVDKLKGDGAAPNLLSGPEKVDTPSSKATPSKKRAVLTGSSFSLQNFPV